MQFAEWVLILVGHLANSCVLFNLVHANATPGCGTRLRAKVREKLIFAAALAPILGVIWFWIVSHDFSTNSMPRAVVFYFAVAKVVGGFFLLRWAFRWLTRTQAIGVSLVSSQRTDIQAEFSESLLVGAKAKLFGKVPFNQFTMLEVQHWELRLPRLPEALSGFQICQLSDLHFTGMIKREYFDAIVERANAAQVDLIVITGDIIDEAHCLNWIQETLSRLSAKHGVYYVLGNHDRRIADQQRLRQRLSAAGLVRSAHGNWQQLQVGDATLWLAGNEMPWYPEAANLPRQPEKTSQDFFVLLSHSPDQIGWAVGRDFDLMFAGHTHGGQIRLPLVGPIIAPSRYGIKFASGTFRIRNTMLHVSRGLSSDEPIRINCPPELGIFKLLKC